MSILELSRMLGTGYTIVLNGLTIEVEVTNIKQSYGKTRYLVKPIAGSGEVWVESVIKERGRL